MFLLVPAHPGCPGQIPQSRKMVVCVCVCYYVSLCFIFCFSVFFSLFFSILAKILSAKSVPKMTCFVSSGTLIIYSMNQSIQWFESVVWVTDRKGVQPVKGCVS